MLWMICPHSVGSSPFHRYAKTVVVTVEDIHPFLVIRDGFTKMKSKTRLQRLPSSVAKGPVCPTHFTGSRCAKADNPYNSTALCLHCQTDGDQTMFLLGLGAYIPRTNRDTDDIPKPL
jgi:hypothetical protein